MNRDFEERALRMWDWLRERHRKRILEEGFPPAWEIILQRNVAHYRRLDLAGRKVLHELVQVFVAEKHWEGCGGLELSDEIRVTIAAQACLMILALPYDLYRDVDSILVYPSTVVPPARRAGVFETSQGVEAGPIPILGRAQLHGPVILVWDSVLQTARHPESGHNLVYHEFAHKLDMLDSRADGTPPLGSPAQYRNWVQVFSTEFLKLRKDTESGRVNFLDGYGATNEAEFFAVVTEQFFDQPSAMKKHHPALYEALQGFYLQDPAASGICG